MLRENRTSADVCIKDIIKKVGKLQNLTIKNFWFVGWDFPASVATSRASMKGFFKEIGVVFHFFNSKFSAIDLMLNFFLMFCNFILK